MHFNLLELTIRKNMYGFGILNHRAKSLFSRHLFAIYLNQFIDGWHLYVHGLFCVTWKIF